LSVRAGLESDHPALGNNHGPITCCAPRDEQVDDLAFAFIASLGADDCDVCHIAILDFGLPILDWNLKSKI
jgi:hypothetical protein